MKLMFKRFTTVFVFILTLGSLLAFPVHADVNDFSFSSFDADYYLSKDSEGRSTLRVVERLTAEFVNKDQNRGIERAIPKNYDGHSVSFKFESLKRNGVVEQIHEQRQEGEFIIISTRRDDYVNGTQEYTLTYTLRDVIKDFKDHQEFYWDTNGTGWRQRFDHLTARVHIDDSVYDAFKGEVSCYKGAEGSNASCDYTTEGSIISFNSGGALNSGENLTVNLSFGPNTFKSYQLTFSDMIPYFLLVAAGILLGLCFVIKYRYGRDSSGKGLIIREYLPPKGISLLKSAVISRHLESAYVAQIMDLAVKHKIRIIESEQKAFIGVTVSYTLELLSVEGLSQDDLMFIDILFGFGIRQVGSKYKLDRNDYTKFGLVSAHQKSVAKQAEEEGYRTNNQSWTIMQYILLSGVVLLSFIALVMLRDRLEESLIWVGGIIGLALFSFIVNGFDLTTLRPLTAKGRELYDYLKGLEQYIGMSEIERLKVLQSPEGAEKVAIDTNSASSMIVLYEKLLPYAVLFKQEKQWLSQLGQYYNQTNTTPSWYWHDSGQMFSASHFASSMSSLSSYSNSSSSSSSSGAGGGGSSGGGGGGGGGGGV